MLNSRAFNIFTITLILVWIWADHFFNFGTPAYGWILLLYVSVLFCGSYFIRLGFFMKSICFAKTREKKIALSFDDGPAGDTTSRILDILKAYQAEAAFFCIGNKMNSNKELLVRMIREGHMIGNHSYSHHRFFDLYRPGKMMTELEKTRKTCLEITGCSPRFFRPPYGVTNPNLKKAVLSGGYISIGWSIRSFDTVIRDEERLLGKILGSLKPGSIILLHDTCEITVNILPRLIKNIYDQGYRLERLDKMINLNPYD